MDLQAIDIKGSLEVGLLAVVGYNTHEITMFVSDNFVMENPTTVELLDISIKFVVLGAAIFKFMIERRKWLKGKDKE